MFFFFTPKRRIARNRASRRQRAGASRSPQQTQLDRSASNLSALAFVSKAKNRLGMIPRRLPIFLLFFFVFLCCCCAVLLIPRFACRVECVFCSPTGLGKARWGRQFCFGRPSSARFAQISQSKPTLPPFLANVAVFRGRGRALRSVCQARRAPPGLSGFFCFSARCRCVCPMAPQALLNLRPFEYGSLCPATLTSFPFPFGSPTGAAATWLRKTPCKPLRWATSAAFGPSSATPASPKTARPWSRTTTIWRERAGSTRKSRI